MFEPASDGPQYPKPLHGFCFLQYHPRIVSNKRAGDHRISGRPRTDVKKREFQYIEFAEVERALRARCSGATLTKCRPSGALWRIGTTDCGGLAPLLFTATRRGIGSR
jgi:hypothetical protein